jgi:phosphatidate cytidylyltransferase
VVLGLLFWNHSPTWMIYLPFPGIFGAILLGRDRAVFFLASVAILLACYALVAFRGGLGLGFVLWLCLVVIASDTLGYFAGRLIGGPKFWPRLSPKKTWSGTVAGWAGASVVGAAFWFWAGAPGWIVPFSALVALAGQLGDIGESAIKRRSGVKDASHLIPGHGGLMDRLDALSGAALFLLAWGTVLPLPAIGVPG